VRLKKDGTPAKKRGRPRKTPGADGPAPATGPPPAKRPRGRPRKTPAPAPTNSNDSFVAPAWARRRPSWAQPANNSSDGSDESDSSDSDSADERPLAPLAPSPAPAAAGPKRGRPPSAKAAAAKAARRGSLEGPSGGSLGAAAAPGPSRRGNAGTHPGSSPGFAAHDDDYMGSDVARHEPQMDAVVKVFCTHTEPNYSLPWQRKRQVASTSSGFVIPGNLVLTNAHSVEHHTQVKLKKRGEDKKYVAKVLSIGVECDLALLRVEDDAFFRGVEPVTFGQLPNLQSSVTVVGYPIGGVAISVTQGVVSRIEVTAYSHGSAELLGLQIDAAINSGNSGGPAFNADGECVGAAFQSLKHDDAENIGYVIPTPVIVHFLKDYEKNGLYTGFPNLGLDWQKLENPEMRKYLRMKHDQHGVFARRVSPVGAAADVFRPKDVLLSFDGVDVADDGTVPFRTGERISFHYLVSEKYCGETARVTFLRDGVVKKATLKLSRVPRLVPVHIEGAPPTYFIVAGIVFTVVCVPYLKSEYGKDYDYDAPVKLLDRMMHHHVKEKGQNVVVVSQVLAADINIGYEEINNTAVTGFNGVAVKNLAHLAEMVERCKEEYLRFELEHEQLVVLKTKDATKATTAILKTHCIPHAKSQDLRR